MPCRREEEEEAGDEAEGEDDDDSFLLLQQSVTLGGSADVDQLIAQIGETLQLDAAHDDPASPCAVPGPPPPPPPRESWRRCQRTRPWPRRGGCCERPRLRRPGTQRPGAVRCVLGERGRVRGRAAPYCVAELSGSASALSGLGRRGWLPGAVTSRRIQQRRWAPGGARAGDDDPHRLLQQLVLSGNLIKEAVRRLQRAVAAVAATSPASAPGSVSGRSGPDSVTLQPSGAWL